MAMSKTKKRGWFVTIAILAVVALVSAFNSEKITSWVNEKAPSIGKMLTAK